MLDALLVEQNGRLLVVWFDAAHVVRFFGRQVLDESHHRVLEQRSGRQRTFGSLQCNERAFPYSTPGSIIDSKENEKKSI